jgi:hypothetical protein
MAGNRRSLEMALRQAARVLVLGTCAALLLPLPAPRAEESGWKQAVGRFGIEKTLAEDCVVLLKSAAVRDPMQRVQGQRIYARARADVDGLIALMEADLVGDRSPAAVPELTYRLESVASQRQALCEHVDAATGALPPERTPAAALPSEGTEGTAISLFDAAVQIWEAYRSAGSAERERIIAALAATRWRDYAEASPGARR